MTPRSVLTALSWPSGSVHRAARGEGLSGVPSWGRAGGPVLFELSCRKQGSSPGIFTATVFITLCFSFMALLLTVAPKCSR